MRNDQCPSYRATRVNVVEDQGRPWWPEGTSWCCQCGIPGW